MTYSTKAVAKMFGWHIKNVNYYYNKYGIGTKRDDARLRFTDDDIAEIKKLREAKGK